MSKGNGSDNHPEESRLGGLARRLAARALGDPRVQEATAGLKHRAGTVRLGLRDRADERLEALLEARAASGSALSTEAEEALRERRQRRQERQAQQLARERLLAVATTTEERRVLMRVLDATPWAGGEGTPIRYTALLDALAPGGEPQQEMAVHRAIWALAEREILSVSPHGHVTAVGQSSKRLAPPVRVEKDGTPNEPENADD